MTSHHRRRRRSERYPARNRDASSWRIPTPRVQSKAPRLPRHFTRLGKQPAEVTQPEHPSGRRGSTASQSRCSANLSNLNTDLTAGLDLTQAKRIGANRNLAFQGIGKVGDFDIPESVALDMMQRHNPHGRPNTEVIKRWINGTDIAQRPRNMWVINFGVDMPVDAAALYETPFEYVKEKVMPTRIKNKMRWRAENWWLHGYPATTMRQALAPLSKYIGTPKVAKHRFFVWLGAEMLPSNLN